MTTSEKTAYVNALLSLYNNDPNQDVIQDLENNYWYYYDDIYGDLSSSPCENNIYLPFNRMTLWEMENALQRQNPRLTVPYWDFTVNNSPTDSLFTFLNENVFPSAWYIQWYVGGGSPLPTASQVQAMQNSTQFCDDNNYSNSYNDQMVNGLDPDVQYWVGGSVGVDGDPLYFVYHAMLDKLWQQWQTKTLGTAIYGSIDRYDGVTTNPYFFPLPYASVNATLDARTMGTFYSNNDTALLSGGYNVSNTYMTPEYFSYPNRIVVGNFNVPAGNSADIFSQTGVTIDSGFVLNGGNLEIDVGSSYYNSFPLAKASRQNTFNEDPSPALDAPQEFTLIRSPQGFTARIWLQNPSEVQGYLMSIDGKIVSRVAQAEQGAGYSEFQLNVPRGGAMYIAYFHVGNQTFKQMLPQF
jgi:tyrosinase